MTVGEALERLRSADARVRRDAALVLEERGDLRAVSSLVNELKDHEAAVRRAAEAAP